MQIQMDDNTGITVTILGIGLLVVALILGWVHMHEKSWRHAITSGYVEKQRDGSQYKLWTKP